MFEEAVQELEAEIKGLRKREQKHALDEEERREEERRKRHCEEEIKLEEAKVRMKQEFEAKWKKLKANRRKITPQG